MSPTQLPDAQSKLLQQCWPAVHLAPHAPPQSTSPSSPSQAPSRQCGTQQPVTPSQTYSWPQTSTMQSPCGQLELAQAGSAASMRPLQSSSRPLSQISVGLVGTHPRRQTGSEPLVSSTRSVPFALTTWITEEQVAPQEAATNAIFRPSGYQAGWLWRSPFPALVSCVTPDPSAFITKISRLPVRSLVNAILVPSGDQAGSASGAG